MRLSHPFLLAVLASTGACSTKIFEVADTTTPVACLVSQLSVSPPQANMNVGERLRATALTRDCPGGPTPAAVRWNSTDTLIARVDSTGLIETRKIGAVSIIATLIADPTVKAAMIVNVSGF